MNAIDRYCSRELSGQVIAFSMSYQPRNLLSRGLGLEHLQELLLRLARTILRKGASLAFGGNWKDTEDNFTYELLRLIKAEQEEESLQAKKNPGSPDYQKDEEEKPRGGILYNHVAWPYYLEITPRIEAQWINCCNVVRITRQMAGFPEGDDILDEAGKSDSSRALFHEAVTLSAQRRLMMSEMKIPVSDVERPFLVPPVSARILMAGKADGFRGFLPGLFEEALSTLDQHRPLYILGGFGGTSELLAQAMLQSGTKRPLMFTAAGLQAQDAKLAAFLKASAQWTLPHGCSTTGESLDALFKHILAARKRLAATLDTGLSDAETRELMTTSDIGTAVRLVERGLKKLRHWKSDRS